VKTKKVIELLEANGWELKRMRGSHRQYRRMGNPNVVTVAGKPNEDVDKGTLGDIRRDSGIEDIR
jgi:predicted RNA binding protein YcfA (HicA-like mRNA interferase family)